MAETVFFRNRLYVGVILDHIGDEQLFKYTLSLRGYTHAHARTHALTRNLHTLFFPFMLIFVAVRLFPLHISLLKHNDVILKVPHPKHRPLTVATGVKIPDQSKAGVL